MVVGQVPLEGDCVLADFAAGRRRKGFEGVDCVVVRFAIRGLLVLFRFGEGMTTAVVRYGQVFVGVGVDDGDFEEAMLLVVFVVGFACRLRLQVHPELSTQWCGVFRAECYAVDL